MLVPYHRRCASALVFGLALAVCVGVSVVDSAAAQTTGDRLVVAVNNIPYSQRQVEAYVAVKESLRKIPESGTAVAAAGAVRLVDAGNWGDALAVFTEDMIILQEAHRLGSFATLDQTVEKFQGVVKDRAARAGTFRSALSRLGVDDQALVRTLEDVLRVAAFRRARERPQEASAPDDDKGEDGGAPSWLVELTDRAVVRQFSGAESFVAIAPPSLMASPATPPSGAQPTGSARRRPRLGRPRSRKGRQCPLRAPGLKQPLKGRPGASRRPPVPEVATARGSPEPPVPPLVLWRWRRALLGLR